MTMSLDNLKIGKKYRVCNYGEESNFTVLERLRETDYKVKDLLSLDVYKFSDLIKYGMSEDFDIHEIA